MTRPGVRTREVNLHTIRVGDTILGTPQRTVLDMRRVDGGRRRLTLSDGTTRVLKLGDGLVVLRQEEEARR